MCLIYFDAEVSPGAIQMADCANDPREHQEDSEVEESIFPHIIRPSMASHRSLTEYHSNIHNVI